MRSGRLLLRQVHPNFVERGRVPSQAFRPTRKDRDKLSVDDGDRVTPEEAFAHYTRLRNRRSVGVLAVTVFECRKLDLHVAEGPLRCAPLRRTIDFSGLSKARREGKAKRLRECAQARGWLHGPVEGER